MNLASALRLCIEAKESDFFAQAPGEGAPSSSHEVKIVNLKAVPGGERWFSKQSQDDLQTINEYLTWRIYKASGMRVAPNAVLVLDNKNRPRFVSSAAAGKQVPASADPVKALKGTDFKLGLFVDTFLGNWDVVGNAPRFNVFIDDSGKVSRIDTGGLDFRAMGERKHGKFTPDVDELRSMGGIGGPSRGSKAAQAYADMSKSDLQKAANVWRKLTWGKVKDVVRGASEEIEELLKDENPQLAQRAKSYIKQMMGIMKQRHAFIDDAIDTLGV